MPVIVWLAAAAVASSVLVAWWALADDREATQRASQRLGDYRPTMREAELNRSAAERWVLPLIRSIGSQLLRFTPTGWVESKNLSLAKAGWTGRIAPEQILGGKLLLTLLVFGLLVTRVVQGADSRTIVLLTAATIAAFVIPDVLVRAAADRRADAITMALPDLLDQLTISVEAGLGFETALARIAKSNADQPLSQEFGRMLQDIQFGTGRVDALDKLAERSQVEDLKTVVLSLRQSESLGVPLAQTLRNVSADMREKRRYRAEERAHRLPTVMILPLGICILPALFIIVLGPAIVTYLASS